MKINSHQQISNFDSFESNPSFGEQKVFWKFFALIGLIIVLFFARQIFGNKLK